MRLLDLGDIFVGHNEPQHAVGVKPVYTDLKPRRYSDVCRWVDTTEVFQLTRHQAPYAIVNQARFHTFASRVTDFQVVLPDLVAGTGLIALRRRLPALVDGD